MQHGAHQCHGIFLVGVEQRVAILYVVVFESEESPYASLAFVVEQAYAVGEYAVVGSGQIG